MNVVVDVCVLAVEGGIHSPSNSEKPSWYYRKLPGWVHFHLIPESIMASVKSRFGNFVVDREVKSCVPAPESPYVGKQRKSTHDHD